ncbi:hypothetical protein C8Q70DRAFT_351557 [Cubamyces menziesii]|nr:hypothetical protein C8Q70DRAFT_351557 [Cubamyces menziesii]
MITRCHCQIIIDSANKSRLYYMFRSFAVQESMTAPSSESKRWTTTTKGIVVPTARRTSARLPLPRSMRASHPLDARLSHIEHKANSPAFPRPDAPYSLTMCTPVLHAHARSPPLPIETGSTASPPPIHTTLGVHRARPIFHIPSSIFQPTRPRPTIDSYDGPPRTPGDPIPPGYARGGRVLD